MEDLRVRDDRGIEKVRGVSFQVHEGEIVGLAGVDGNGQTELIDAITGPQQVEAGKIEVAGEEVTRAGTRASTSRSASVTSRRIASGAGLVLDFSIAENMSLQDFREEPNSRFGWLFPWRLIEHARQLI